jgi:predicted O-methyltransferase YrrM
VKSPISRASAIRVVGTLAVLAAIATASVAGLGELAWIPVVLAAAACLAALTVESRRHTDRLIRDQKSAIRDLRQETAGLRKDLRRQHRQARAEASLNYQQVEALLSIFSSLEPKQPFPTLREWTASPDLLKRIAEIALRQKPEVVVEAGSGATTLVLAYCLERNGRGKIWSLDHDAGYAQRTRDLLEAHGLGHRATVSHAPLSDVDIRGESWPWYDRGSLETGKPIDLLIVDGPPGKDHPLARYPALPLLRSSLAAGATVVLDDADRDDETAIAARWCDEFEDLVGEHIALERGAFVLTVPE